MNNTRRDFLKKAGLIGVLAIVSPNKILNAARLKSGASMRVNEKSGDGFVFLFQGDSITDGNRGRSSDPNHIMGHGYAFSIASRVGADHPEKHLTFYNRGISGNKVSDLAARWQTDCLDLKPDVLSILVGINDIDYTINSGDKLLMLRFEETFQSLLAKVKEVNPNVLIVLCLPFILPVGRVADRLGLYELGIAQLHADIQNVALEYNALVVDFQQVMTNACKRAPADYWMWDGIHPTVAGHELLAREWIKVVGKRLTFVKYNLQKT